MRGGPRAGPGGWGAVWTVPSSFTFIAVGRGAVGCEAGEMGQLVSRRSLLYFLLFFTGSHET